MTDVVSTSNQWPRSSISGFSQQQYHHRKNIRRTLARLANERSPRTTIRKVTLYRNGDRYFPGKQITILPQNYTKFRQLLHELSSTIDLPYGIRRLFTPQSGSEITDVNSLKDGASYVCASFEPFQKLDYVANYLPHVTFNIEQLRQPLHDYNGSNRVNLRQLPSIPLSKLAPMNGLGITSNRFHAQNLLLQSLSSSTNSSSQQQLQPTRRFNYKQNKYGLEASYNKPRSITIVKQGDERPHKTITILLNRRTGQTFDQLLSDISEAFGNPKQRSERIKRLFTLKGRLITGINDFFREDDLFIAATISNEISPEELQEITLELGHNSQNRAARRNHIKKQILSPINSDSNTPLAQAGLVTVDIKRTVNVRDSAYIDDDDNPNVAKDHDTTSSRVPHTTRASDMTNEDPHTSNDFIIPKTKKPFKPAVMLNIEYQRERERQRMREEEDRRRRLLTRKEYQPSQQLLSLPKFELLVLDKANDDPLNTNKSKDDPPGENKLVPRINVTNSVEANEGKLAVPSLVDIKKEIKKRSTVIHPSPAIVTDKYELGKKMGDGNFAIVRRSKTRINDREFAIKIIDKSKMKGKEYMLDHEINIMYQCHHTNIIRLFEDYETADEIYLVMELIKGGDLFDYISKHRRFDEPTSALMIKDVSEALLYLHTNKIVHRDLKPENLLVMQRKDGRITIKLTDFGLAMRVTGPIKTVCGTPTYVAPEILAETGYGVEVDCWATGIILFILLCGYPPFKAPGRNQEELFKLIQRGTFFYDPEYWEPISTDAKNLIDHLLVVDYHKRLRANDILLHPWIMSAGHSKPMGNTEDLKSILRKKYDEKTKEYLMEGIAI